MLMPPQNTQTPSPAPENFDFMMKEPPKPPGRFSGLFSWMPKPAKIVLAAVGGLFVLVILYAVFFGGKTTNTDQLTSVMARAQEISRVSALVQQQAKDASTKDLATTAEAVLSSQEQGLKSYLSDRKVKVSSKKLAARLDKNTDDSLEKALQNNSYDQTYFSYLKTNLVTYQDELDATYKGSSKDLQPILSGQYQSIKTLLTAPQLK